MLTSGVILALVASIPIEFAADAVSYFISGMAGEEAGLEVCVKFGDSSSICSGVMLPTHSLCDGQ